MKHSSSIQDCLLAEDSTSDDSNTCISCSLTNTAVGTCVVVVHTKPSLLRNSYRGLQDISVLHLNNSAVDGRCSGCIDGVSLNDCVIVVFLYINGTIVSDSHVFISQRPSSNTGTHIVINIDITDRALTMHRHPWHNYYRKPIVMIIGITDRAAKYCGLNWYGRFPYQKCCEQNYFTSVNN